MENPILHYFLRQFNTLAYQYRFFAYLKDKLRSVKYFIFGKSEIAFAIGEVKDCRTKNNPIKIIFDIGAAIGDKTITMIKTFPEATAYAFEPQIESVQKMEQRVGQHKDRVKIFNFGFFDKNTELPFHIKSYRDASSLFISEHDQEDHDLREIETRLIQVMRLDDFVAQHEIKHIDFMKIDVEGAEKGVLEGGKDTFLNKVDNVFIEISSPSRGQKLHDLADIVCFFADAGFVFVGKYGDYFFSKDAQLIKKIFPTA